MEFIRRVVKSIPTTPQLPGASTHEKGRSKNKYSQRWGFLLRPQRLIPGSSIAVPIGVVLLIPIAILSVLLVIFFIRNPNSTGRMLMPAGAPPAIRYYFPSSCWKMHESLHWNMAADIAFIEKLANSMTRSL